MIFDVDRKIITSRKALKKYLINITDFIKMNRYGKPQVYRFGKGNLKGYSGVQLIEESCITFHCNEQKGHNDIYIDIFSCCYFNQKETLNFNSNYFNAKKIKFYYRKR